MALSRDRWVEVTRSQFEHEAEGLDTIRKLLPNSAPYRAWSNFEFRDSQGRWHEVDLLVLGKAQLHLIELKYYSGVLTGDDHRWLRAGKPPEDSPLKLARRKAQYLASRLKDAARDWERETKANIPDLRRVVPFVQESVFLHHPRFTSQLSEHSAQGIYAPDHMRGQTNLPGISEILLEPPQNHRTVTASNDRLLPVLMKRLGFEPRRERTAGSWTINEALLGEGDGWQDWSAHHQVDQTHHSRIRFRVPPPGATNAKTKELKRIAQHEFGTMTRLVHDGLLRPIDMVESDLGTGLVYPYEDSLQRLDLWLANKPDGLPLETQLNIVRQIAEAVHYAHGSAVAHRDLTPEAIWVRPRADDAIKVLVGDWHSAGIAGGTPATGLPQDGVTALYGAGSRDALEHSEPSHSTYRAPEDTWRATATDRFRLDVFGLGALAYYVLTGQPPAASPAALRDRLRQQGGLDISPELPGASEPLRALILSATKPTPSERTADLAKFLEQLSVAETTGSPSQEPDLDPLDARPGDVIAGRFTLNRRLGQGSTAVGLLVTDRLTDGEPERVLKVALDDDAARRLSDEAEVLKTLSSPRIVRLIEGPVTLAGRRALVLDVAGTQTLAEVLRDRARMSIDLLERYGTDLLEALIVLDKAAVDHRDIKPANLGVQMSRGYRIKHLVLFDFSLTRAAASATEAGTPPYLDPFLKTNKRPQYDSSAERYAASVVLFEMATGATPTYGDGTAHPGSVEHEANVAESAFDPSISKAMVAFFTKALAREAEERHHTAEEMLREWSAAVSLGATTVPDNAEDLVNTAKLETRLVKAGLSARALSAIEPLGVDTVGDLVALDAVRLNTLSGTGVDTRSEVKSRAKQWRTKFSDAIRGMPSPSSATSLPSPQDAAEVLLAHVGKRGGDSHRQVARFILGIGTDLEAFATHAQLGAHLSAPVGAARVTQIINALQTSWAGNDESITLIARLDETVGQRLTELGEVATVEELAATLLATMTPTGHASSTAERDEIRLAMGLLRVVLDRRRAQLRADVEVPALHTRRREGRMSLVTTVPDLLDVAESLGREADRLVVADTGLSHNKVVPADLVAERLSPIIQGAAVLPFPAELSDPGRQVRLAAATSTHAAASGAAELHHRDLPAAAAVSLTLRGAVVHQHLSPHSLRDRVRARFPSLPPLPERPRLDSIVDESGVDVIYDAKARAYRGATSAQDTTGLGTRPHTHVVREVAPISVAGVAGQRLRDSSARRSFLALGVPGHRLERAIRVLEQQYVARPLDLTEVLLAAVRDQADAVGMKWSTVQAADAAASGSRPALGLATLVERAMPAVTAAIEQSMSEADEGDRPVLLTDAGPMARYGHLGLLSQWTDLTRARHQAVWLVVPQLRNSFGPKLDGQSLTLNSPGQFLPLDTDWIDARDDALTTDHMHAGVSS